MARHLRVCRGDEILIDFDKRDASARMQFAYVQKMDAHMDQGIRLHGETLADPTPQQRMQFVIGELLQALNLNDTRAAGMMCRYLAHRVPTLDRIDLVDTGDSYEVRLVFDESVDETAGGE